MVISPTLEATDRGRQLTATLERHGTVHRISDRELGALAATESPQGVVMTARIPRPSLADLDAQAAILLVLDGVQDPGNAGTLIRCADAFGVAAVVALPGTVDPWNPKVVRGATGSSCRVPILLASLPQLGDWLHDRSFQVLGADGSGESVAGVRPVSKLALLAGNEGAGLSPEARSLADHLVAVPIPGRAESLNVAVAIGILLYELTKAR